MRKIEAKVHVVSKNYAALDLYEHHGLTVLLIFHQRMETGIARYLARLVNNDTNPQIIDDVEGELLPDREVD